MTFLAHTIATMVDDIDLLLAYLANLDLLGFVVACYTTRIGEAFYALIMFTFSVIIYNRTQNLMYCIILWLLVGTLGFVAAAPSISAFAVFLVVMGCLTLILRQVLAR